MNRLLFARFSSVLAVRLTPRISCRVLCENAADHVERKYKKMRGGGDKGKSSLCTGERRWKDDMVFEALGATDELSAALGKMRYMCDEAGLFDVTEKLIEIQCTLQDLCSHIATPLHSKASDVMREHTKFDIEFAHELDKWIDYYANDLPPLTQFILPGGSLLASCMHEARCICRRAERSVIPLLREEQIDSSAVTYLNRLSDLMFILGRYVCHHTKSDEISYKKRRPNLQEADRAQEHRHTWKQYKI